LKKASKYRILFGQGIKALRDKSLRRNAEKPQIYWRDQDINKEISQFR
jgi:hypothetical protein